MATSFNQCTFIGRLGRDPELSYSTSGEAVAKCSIAVDRSSKNKNQDPMWVNIVAWSRLAEVVSQYATKGMLVLVQGRLDVRTYTDRNNVVRASIDLIASTVQFLSPTAKADETGPGADASNNDPAPF